MKRSAAGKSGSGGVFASLTNASTRSRKSRLVICVSSLRQRSRISGSVLPAPRLRATRASGPPSLTLPARMAVSDGGYEHCGYLSLLCESARSRRVHAEEDPLPGVRRDVRGAAAERDRRRRQNGARGFGEGDVGESDVGD